MANLARDLVVSFRDFIYPPLCFVCGQRLSSGTERVCGTCWSSFTALRDDDAVVLELRRRFVENGAVSDFLSCYLFEKEGKLQDVIHLLKYGGVKSMGVMLGREVGRLILRCKEFSTADCLVPVPLHKLKRRERGYNQSEMICRGVSEVTGIPTHPNMIVRFKYTTSQTQLDLEERQKNVGDAFTIPLRYISQVRDKRIILVDDVITTGSTINACATQLVKAGATAVMAASAAAAQ